MFSKRRQPGSSGNRNGHPSHAPGLLLGWDANDAEESFGFSPMLASANPRPRPVLYNGDAPLITCGPTGSGKGRGTLIPNLLIYPDPVIVMDIKGELYQVCARQRRELGHRVIALDPFNLVTNASDSLNPLDLLKLPKSSTDGDAEMLASLLAVGHHFTTDPYWSDTSMGLIAGLIAHVATAYPPAARHLGQLRAWLYHDDMDMAIAKALDERAVVSRLARDQFVAYLSAPCDKTRPCIRSVACTYINALGSDQVAATLKSSTFSLHDVLEGKPLSIFIIIPPDKLESHKALLRLWVGTLLTVVTRRQYIPRQRTLFLLDEVAQLGSLDALRQAVTLLRGSGLQVWTFWQDLSQLRQRYPQDWQTMVNNAAVLQFFGVNNCQMAKEWGELVGQQSDALLHLTPEQAVVQMHGQGTRVCRRPDYLRDEVFAGLYDDNKRFALVANKRPPNLP